MHQSGHDLFGDSLVLETKRLHVLEWIKRRAREAFCGITSNFVSSPSATELQGDREHLVKVLFGSAVFQNANGDRHEELLNSLRAEALVGGLTNLAIRVWASQLDPASGVFVKVALPSARWLKKASCDVSRLNNEFLCLGRLDSICPGAGACPILCGSDECHSDGARYLVTEYISQEYDKYSLQFKDGKVDMRAAKEIGQILAKLHVQAPSRFNGKDEITNVTAKSFMTAIYIRFMEVTLWYTKVTDFTSKEAQSHSTLAFDPRIASKHAALLRSHQPELFRALSRHRDNYNDPPYATGTFAHLDAHTVNIMVTSAPPSLSDACHSLPLDRYTTKDESVGRSLVKWVDMEFSNWGPAGADLGTFFSSVLLYALVYSYSDDAIQRSDDMLLAITNCWSEYRDAYIRYGELEGRSLGSIIVSLYGIVHEALGWAGHWIFRLTGPAVFSSVTMTDFLYALPAEGTSILLQRRRRCYAVEGETNEVEDGIEVLRYAASVFALQTLLNGFGDEASERTSHAFAERSAVDIQSCNELIESLTLELKSARNHLKEELNEMIELVGYCTRNETSGERDNS